MKGDDPFHDHIAVAELLIAGRSLLEYQLDVALALNAEKLAVYATSLSDELIALQHRAERAGLGFQLIDGTGALAAMAGEDDDILVLRDGLMLTVEAASIALDGKHAITAFAADKAVAAGYERMDSTRAFAGLMLVPGSAAIALSALPEDAEPVSALLRTGLQTGSEVHLLPDSVEGTANWRLITSDVDVDALDRQMVNQRLGERNWYQPGCALAITLARHIASPLLARGIGAGMVCILGVLLVLAAIAAAVGAGRVWGFATLTLAALVFAFAEALGGISDSEGTAPRITYIRRLSMSAALLLVAVAPWQSGVAAQILAAPLVVLFVPLVVFASWTIAGSQRAPQWLGFTRDPTVLPVLLSLFAAIGWFYSGMAVLALAILSLIMLFSKWPGRR